MKALRILLLMSAVAAGTAKAQTVTVSGPTTAIAGESKVYNAEFRDQYNQVITPPNGTHLWQAYTGTIQFNSASAATVQWTTAGSQYVQYEMETFDNYFYGAVYVTVASNNPPTPTAGNVTYTYNCGNTVVTRGTSPPSGVEWYWQTTSNGTSTSLGSSASITRTASGNLYLRARRTAAPNEWSDNTQLISNVTVYTTPPAAATVANPSYQIGSGSATVSVGTVAGASEYVWYLNNVKVNGQTTNSYTTTTSATTTYQVATKNPGCENSTRLSVTATVYPTPEISKSNNGVISQGNPVTLSVSNFTFDAYTWKDGNGNTIPGATGSSYVATVADNYKVSVTKGTAPAYQTPTATTVTKGVDGLNMNLIVSNTIQVEGVTSESAIGYLPAHQNAQTIQYFDGLGRPIQTVSTQASPSKNDIVQPIVYDNYGRETVKYLPYVAGQDGWYKTSPVSASGSYTGSPHHTFYTQTNTLIARDAKPYAVTVFESSPLNRVIKQGAPGDTWQPDGTNTYASTDHTIKRSYEFNGANEVLLWSYTSPTTTYPLGLVNAGTVAANVYYGAGQLMRNKTKDEQGHEVIEYTDKQGRVVLKRVQTGASQTINDTNYAGTYYIYDDFGNLVTVIPPEATKLITQTSPASEYFDKTDAVKDAFLKRWAFRYAYDGRKRMTIKQVPGAEPVYMVYDKRDRLVMTQDGNQRTTKQWLFTKYDLLNRPVTTGLLKTDSVLTQSKMQTRVNNYYNNLGTNGGAWGESYIGSGTGNVHGYNNLSYPKTDTVNNYLTVTYYDNYDFLTLFNNAVYIYKEGELSGQASTNFARVTGQVTGTKTKVLQGSTNSGATWLKAVSYYDDKYRVIQAIADNYKGGIDRITSRYDFVGKVLKTKSVHITQDVQWTATTAALGTGNRLVGVPSPVGWGTSGAISVKKLAASTNGWMEFQTNVPAASNGHKVVGLSDLNSDNHYNTIDYAFYVREDKNLYVYENGVNKWSQTAGYTPGDVLKIERTGTTIKYYKNGTLVYTSATASSAQLMVDAAFYGTQSEIYNVRASFSTETDSLMQRFEYDHAGRMLKAWQKIDNEAEVMITRNQYNELGELITKGLHSTDGNNFKQVVDHRYNIRGWLTRINNADVSNTTDGGPRDFFGMELAYENNLGIGTHNAQYNGNINAIKWSSNLGLADVKERGYTFSYHPMNRLTGAAHQQKNTSWASTTAFREDNLTYDLNGNIKALQRSDASGALIDNLTYDYGTSTSNKLMKVTDAADNAKGFKESDFSYNPPTADYVYDANGNMISDWNKKGGEVLKNGSFDNGSTNWTVTDVTPARVSFSNGELVIGSGTGSAQVIQGGIEKGKSYILVVDMVRTSANDGMTFRVGGTSYIVTNTGVTTLSVTAGTSNTNFEIINGAGFMGSVKSVSLSGVAQITYNHLNLPATVSMPGDKTLTYYYDATGRKLSQVLATSSIVTKKTDYANEYIYENDTLQFINTAEGRYVANAGAITGGEYQYHLKDHLGNVRLTFTTKQETESHTATLETSNEAAEQAKFLRYSNAKRVNSRLFDKTNGSTDGFSQRLSGGVNERYGLARSLSVMPGDTVKMEVYAKYVDSDTVNWTSALNVLMGQITDNAGGVVVDGVNYTTSTTTFPYPGLQNTSGSSGTGPKAFLNWLVFDRDYNFITGGYQRMSTSAKENGQDVAHEKLSGQLVATQPGYVYIYLSNEETTPVDVFFDDFKVTQVKSPVVQSDDYYPFGLAFNSYSRENSEKNNYLYNGKELQDELDLGWLDYGQRMYQPELGKFFKQDRFAEKYFDFSPYQYAGNNPALYIDVNGDSILINHKKDKIIYNNGRLTYAGTNRVYQGKVGKNGQLKGFVGKTQRALDQIRTGGPAGQGLIEGLQNDSRNVQISEGKENSTTGIKVDWNPSNTSGGLDTQGSTNRPAFIGLAHELAHANDLLQDGTVDVSTWFTTADGQVRTNAEKSATHLENQIRSENGLNIREYYTQTPYAPARITTGNTSLHIIQKVNLAPITINSKLVNTTITPSIQIPYRY